MNNSRASRKYERLLFKGTPEQPEHNYERDQHSSVSLRVTGRAQTLTFNESAEEVETLGVVSYNFDKQKQRFRSKR
jgi:hypothetical protein